MLCTMTKTIRTRAAIFFAVFYASLMLAPAAALALDAVKVMHCINDVAAMALPDHEHDAAAKPHAHGKADTNHDHAGKASDRDGTGTPAACCGLFSVAGMVADEHMQLGVAPRIASLMPLVGERRDGEGPGQPNKPPRA